MRSIRAMAAALLCAASGDAFVVPAGGLWRARDAGMRVAATSTGRSRYTHRPAMSLASPPPSPTATSAGSDTRRFPIERISSHDELLNAFAMHQDKLVVIKFYDQFCRACDEIRPRFEELARQRSGAGAFFEIEFTTCKDVCKQMGIRRLPTVQIFSGADGRVADMPAGPSRFTQVEERLAELVGDIGGTSESS